MARPAVQRKTHFFKWLGFVPVFLSLFVNRKCARIGGITYYCHWCYKLWNGSLNNFVNYFNSLLWTIYRLFSTQIVLSLFWIVLSLFSLLFLLYFVSKCVLSSNSIKCNNVWQSECWTKCFLLSSLSCPNLHISQRKKAQNWETRSQKQETP